jgi:pre-mRNA-processing factor 19
MLCAISGEPPQDPVVSTKSSHVYERRLILKYLVENGTDPITGEKFEESDLIPIKTSESSCNPYFLDLRSLAFSESDPFF